VSTGRARLLGAEALGTFALVLFGCGAIMVDAERGGLGQVGVSLAFGLVVMAMVVAFVDVSGAHINPAVTLALAARRRFPWAAVPGYWGAQVAGAIAAAIVLRSSLGDVASLGATSPSGSDAQSFVWEVAMTASLLVVILAVATRPRTATGTAAFAIGGTIALASLVGGPISGASLNPARSLGPALVSGELGSLWIYLTAPLVGGLLGALVYDAIRPPKTA
jgi:MIP family channel proteins